MVSCVGGHICVDSPSKQGKETTLDQSESVNYFNPGKQDELMETCNAAEMVLLLWMRMMPRARLQEGVTGSRNTALRPERLILSFPYLRAPLAAEDVGNILKFYETFREVSRASKNQLLMVPRFGEPDLRPGSLRLKELPAGCFSGGGDGYDALSF